MHTMLNDTGAATPELILMTADTLGGVWTYAVELARILGQQGIGVILATMGGPLTKDQRADLKGLPDLELRESRFKLEWMDEPWEDVQKAGEWLLRIEDERSPDVIHLNGYAHGALPWRAPRLVVAHSCVLSWWQAVRGEPAPRQWDRYRAEASRGIRAADAVVAPSEAMRVELLRYYGSETDCAVISNGRTPGLFGQGRPGEKEEFVLTAGRLWDRAKNVAALAACAPRLSWPLYIAGEDHCPARIGHIDETGPRFDNAHRLGRLSTEALSSWMSRAALYALPTYYEPFGLSALEAGLSGCALVLGDILSLRELWEGAALFVPPGNVEEIGEGIEALIRDRERRRALAEKARQRALALTPRRMAEGYIAVYRRMLEKTAPAAERGERQCAL